MTGWGRPHPVTRRHRRPACERRAAGPRARGGAPPPGPGPAPPGRVGRAAGPPGGGPRARRGWGNLRPECPVPTCGRPGVRQGRPAHMMDTGTHRTGGVDASRAALSCARGPLLATRPHPTGWSLLTFRADHARSYSPAHAVPPTSPLTCPCTYPESAPSALTFQRPSHHPRT